MTQISPKNLQDIKVSIATVFVDRDMRFERGSLSKAQFSLCSGVCVCFLEASIEPNVSDANRAGTRCMRVVTVQGV